MAKTVGMKFMVIWLGSNTWIMESDVLFAITKDTNELIGWTGLNS